MLRSSLPSWLTSQPVAHRGLHDPQRPENTLPAFEAACQAGYPIELDVHVLHDGEVIVFHDEDLQRAADVSRTLWQEDRTSIQRYKLFGSDCTIPTLNSVLQLVAGRVPLLIEIKSRHSRRGMARTIAQQLSSYSGQWAVQSFNPYVIRWFRKHVPQVACGQLAGPLEHDELTTFERFASRHVLGALVSRPHFLNYDLRALPDTWIDAVRRVTQLPLLCWTVRNELDRAKAESLGLNYVFDHIRP